MLEMGFEGMGRLISVTNRASDLVPLVLPHIIVILTTYCKARSRVIACPSESGKLHQIFATLECLAGRCWPSSLLL